MFQRKLRGAGALRGLLRSVSAQGAAVQGRGLAVSREGVDRVPTVYCRPLLERPVDWRPVLLEKADPSVIWGQAVKQT